LNDGSSENAALPLFFSTRIVRRMSNTPPHRAQKNNEKSEFYSCLKKGCKSNSICNKQKAVQNELLFVV